MLHTVTPEDATNRGVLTSMPSVSSDGMFYSTIPREAINVPSPPTVEKFYLPTMSRNEDTAMMPFRHNSPSFSDRVHLPAMSQQNENVCPATSQRPEVHLRSASDSVYLPVAHGNDDTSTPRLNGDISLQQASASLSSVYFPSMVPPQTTDPVPQRAEMYLASAMQRSDEALSFSSSERISIPLNSQEMYIQTPNMSAEKHHREGVP